jgi:hypothetical protein
LTTDDVAPMWRYGPADGSKLERIYNQDRVMRIGMLGVGRIGALHAERLRLLAEVNELILVESDAAQRGGWCRKRGLLGPRAANNS